MTSEKRLPPPGKKLPPPKAMRSASSTAGGDPRKGQPSDADLLPVSHPSAWANPGAPQQLPLGTWKVGAILAAAVFGVLLSGTLWWMLLGPDTSHADTPRNPITESPTENTPQAKTEETKRTPAPSPLILEDLSPISVDLNEGVEWSVALADSLSGPLRKGAQFEPENQLPAGCIVNPSRGQVVWTPNENQGPQDYELKFLVKDPRDQAWARLTYAIHVREVNQPPTLRLPEKLEMKRGQIVQPFVSATDPDWPANKLRFELVKADPIALAGLQIDAESGKLFWEKTAPSAPPTGPQKITIRVSDDAEDSQSTEGQVDLSFLNIEIPEVDLSSVKEGQLVQVPLQAKLPGDPNAQFIYTFVGPPPTGTTIDAKTGEFRWNVPRDAGGTLQTFQLEIAKADDPSVKRTVEFRVTVQKAVDVAYIDLPDLPRVDEKPQTFVFEDVEVAPGTKLKLLGYDNQLLESDEKGPSISSAPRESANQIVAFYEKPKGSLKEELEPKEPVGTFRVAGTKIEFEWEAYKDREIRHFKELLRDAVLEVEEPGKPTKYFALQKPVVIPSPQAIKPLVSEPFEDDDLHRGNPRPTRCRRQLQLENVQLHWKGRTYRGTCQTEDQISTCSFPDAAQDLGFDLLQIRLEDQAGKLIWQCETYPSVRQAYEEFTTSKKQLASMQAQGRKALLAYQKSQAAVNGLLNSSRKVLPQLLRSMQNKAQSSYVETLRCDAEVKKLGPQTAIAQAKYAPLQSRIKPAESATVSLSVYRTVAGLRIDVLRIE